MFHEREVLLKEISAPDPRRRQKESVLSVLPGNPLIMGIVNVTPDSFSDGGRFNDQQRACDHALHLQKEGADILDIGGESSRPGYTEISREEEIDRIIPVIRQLSSSLEIPVSVDTYHAETAAAALEAGAMIVNDIWGLQHDPAMAETVAHHQAFLVAMHNRHEIDTSLDIVDDMLRFFDKSLKLAQKQGVDSAKIILDPGIGFGKTQSQNIAAINGIPHLKKLGFPVLAGLSRKSLIGAITGNPVSERLAGTLTAHLYALEAGADIIRVHDVKAHRDGISTWKALKTGHIK